MPRRTAIVIISLLVFAPSCGQHPEPQRGPGARIDVAAVENAFAAHGLKLMRVVEAPARDTEGFKATLIPATGPPTPRFSVTVFSTASSAEEFVEALKQSASDNQPQLSREENIVVLFHDAPDQTVATVRAALDDLR